jgi:hypothetical protein
VKYVGLLVSIHLLTMPLQTGATLFTFSSTPQNPTSWPYPAFPPSHADQAIWTYSKSERPELSTPKGAWEERFDYVVADGAAEWVEWSDREAGWEAMEGDGGKKSEGSFSLQIGGFRWENNWDMRVLRRRVE